MIKDCDVDFIDSKNSQGQKIKKFDSDQLLELIYSFSSKTVSDKKKLEEIKTIVIKREILEKKYIKREEHELIIKDLLLLVSNFLRAFKSKVSKMFSNKKNAFSAVSAIDDFINNYCEELKVSATTDK